MTGKPNFLRSRIKSFKHAFHGLKLVFQSQVNFKTQLFLAFAAVMLGFLLKISSTEWIVIIVLTGIVLAAESFNSAIEFLCDKVESRHDETIKKVKDISTAAVLISSISALIVGLIIFLPKIVEMHRTGSLFSD